MQVVLYVSFTLTVCGRGLWQPGRLRLQAARRHGSRFQRVLLLPQTRWRGQYLGHFLSCKFCSCKVDFVAVQAFFFFCSYHITPFMTNRKQPRGNFWETGWSAYGFSRELRYHHTLNWTTASAVMLSLQRIFLNSKILLQLFSNCKDFWTDGHVPDQKFAKKKKKKTKERQKENEASRTCTVVLCCWCQCLTNNSYQFALFDTFF